MLCMITRRIYSGYIGARVTPRKHRTEKDGGTL